MAKKRILLLGSDGYIGHYLTTKLRSEGFEVVTVDSLRRRELMDRYQVESVIPYELNAQIILDVQNFQGMKHVLASIKPDLVLNLAQEQCPGLSMMDFYEASSAQVNNVNAALSLYWAIKEVDHTIPIIQAGTLGEFGYDSEERVHDGQNFVEQGRMGTTSFYHISKNQITLNSVFCSMVWGLRIVDIQQTIVEGVREGVPLYYDGIFGTVVNRLITQAITGRVLRYGTGNITRSFLSLEDSVEAFKTVAANVDRVEGYLSLNQFDPKSVKSINELIDIVTNTAYEHGLYPEIVDLPNPRIETDNRTVNVAFEILPSFGFEPKVTVEDEIRHSFPLLMEHKDRIDVSKIMPAQYRGWQRPGG